jgi:tetratricopeptide (TPR) repeat protein
VNVESHHLCEIRDLYGKGLCLQAYALAQKFGPLDQWTGTPARILAGRLAANLGAPRLSYRLHLQAYRDDPEDPEARYYYVRTVAGRRGPFPAWKVLHQHGELPGASPALRSDWMAFYGFVAGVLRDFDTAEYWLARAENLAPENPWVCIERAEVLEFEDRYEESLAAARRSLELHPWYRPGVQATAHALQLLDRDGEALELLQEAAGTRGYPGVPAQRVDGSSGGRIENGPVVAQLALIQSEMRDYAGLQRTLDRFVELSPLMEKEMGQWLAAMRSDAAYHLGDRAAAIQSASAAQTPFFDKITERLEAATGEDRRVLLPVGFVRQHHVTCSPATLSAISRYWAMPADHLAVAEEICYDGTPSYSERKWAEQNGWAAPEFTVTWESAAALLDRGIPFTLTTVAPGNAHLQAVIGYDSRRGTFLVRDPYYRHVGEFLGAEILEQLRSTGPRGMAMVPREKASLLEGIELPDAALHDHHHRLQGALLEHDREQAREAYDAMRATAPEHPLTQHARRSLAAYDADSTGMLACVERLLEQFPDDANLKLARLSSLRDLARQDERLYLLQEICEQKDSDPIFWQQYAQELCADAREHERAVLLLRRAMRRRPVDGGTFYILGNIFWDQRRWEEAVELYRFAACLDDKNEHFSRSYFGASRYLKQTERALLFLRNRLQRFGARSSQPARTLFWALDELDQMNEAFAVLDEALRLRPEDGELLLFAADQQGRHGQFDRAAELLTAAETRSARTAWLRSAAALAVYQGEQGKALDLWREVLEREPLAMDAHHAMARLLAQKEGPAAVRAHFEEASARFPHSYALHQLWAEWLRDDDDPAAAERVLRHLIQINPSDAWTRRELAMLLGRQRRFEEAFAEIDIAYGLEPTSPAYYSVRGEVCSLAERWGEAKEAFREAIRLSVDNGFAIGRLVQACDSAAERREALKFIEGELIRQTIFGDGLLAFRDYAGSILDPEELLASLQEGLEARPDLWHAWSAVIQQAADLDRLDLALDVARQAATRFPLIPAAWLDLALVHRTRRELEEEKTALEQALQISPGWSPAVRQLCSFHRRAGELEEARRLLESAVARDPLDAENHGWLAHALWSLGEKEAAVERLKHALRLDPGYGWAWDVLREWCGELGCPDQAATTARELTVRRPGEARSWLMLARTLSAPEELPERLAALDQAIALNPRCFEAYDLRGELLAEAGRFDEALAGCRPGTRGHPPCGSTGGGENVPTELKGRAAWIEAQRGNMPEAISQMRMAVAEDPSYYWGWLQLARWYDAAGADADYVEASRMLTRLAPQEAYGFGLLGEAKLRAGDRSGAKAAFQRAIELAPEYAFAGMSLFDEQIEDNELDEAARTLEVLLQHANGEWVLARAVRLAVCQKDLEGAAQRLRELAVYPAEDPIALDVAATTMREAGWAQETEQALLEALDLPEVQPKVGELWVQACAARGDWECEWRLPALREKGEIGIAATAAFVEALGNAGQRASLERFIRQNRELLRAHTQTWGSVGYALLTLDLFGETVDWLRDWEGHAGVRPWHLLNLSAAMRYLDRDTEAGEINRRALSLPEDHCTPYHLLWLAADDVLAGNPAEATERLRSIDPEALPPYHQFLYGVVLAGLEVQTAQPEDRAAAFAGARKQLSQARAIYKEWRRDSLLRRTSARAARRIAQDAGGLWPLVWSYLQPRGWI